MHTARRHLAALTAALMGCGPTTVNITTTGEGEAGEESSTTEMPSGSTGLGGSESGPVDTPTSHGASSSGADSSSTTGGGGSSSSGGPSPVCLVPAPDVYICDGVEVEPQADAFGCWCGDIEVSPALCEPGMCSVVNVDDGLACVCDGEIVDPSECGCADTPDGCECFDVSDVNPCVQPIATGCVLVGEGDMWSCTCDGALADPAACGCPASGDQDCICAGASCGPCVPIGAMCLCGDFVAPPEAC